MRWRRGAAKAVSSDATALLHDARATSLHIPEPDGEALALPGSEALFMLSP